MEQGSERREHERMGVDFSVTCHVGSTSFIQLTVNTKDISEGGMRVLIPRELLVGNQVNMVFYLPNVMTQKILSELLSRNTIPKDKNYGKDRLEIASEVMWIQPSREKPSWFEVGLKFLFLDDDQQQLLREYIDNHKNGVV